MEDFRLGEAEQAQIEARAVNILIDWEKGEEGGRVSSEDCNHAFAQLETIKYRLANSTDEQLIADLAGEMKLLDDDLSADEEIPEEGFLTEETLRILIELDLERAARCHEKILSHDNLPVLAVIPAVFNLRHLTDAMGERSTPFWELALDHKDYEVQVAAFYALHSMLLVCHDAFDVSTGQAEKLMVRANEIADVIDEERGDQGWFET